MRRFFTGALVIGVLAALCASAVSAHEQFRVIGTLTRVDEFQIDVKTKDRRTISVKISKYTPVTRDKKEVAVTELQKGRSVVVTAWGDDETDLLALDVRLVPDLPAERSR